MASNILFSDANLIWRNMHWASRSGLKVLETVRLGAVLWVPITVTTNGTITVNFRTIALSTGSIPLANCPVVSVFDCRSPGTSGVFELIAPPHQINPSNSPDTITSSINGDGGNGILTNGGSSKQHLLKIVVDNIRNNVTDQWSIPTQGVEIGESTGGVAVILNGAGSSRAVGAGELPAHKAMAFGDSILIGYSNHGDDTSTTLALAADGANTQTNVRDSWFWLLCQDMGLEPIINGFGGQGISKGGNGCTWNGTAWTGGTTVPAAFAGGSGIVGGVGAAGAGQGVGPTWSLKQAGLGSLLSAGLFTDAMGAGDYLFDCHVQNDGTLANFSPATNAGRQAAYQAWWNALHAAAPASTLVAINGFNPNAGAYADKKAAAQTYSNTGTGPFLYVDVSANSPLGIQSSLVQPNIDSHDGLHPSFSAHGKLAALVKAALSGGGISFIG